MRFNPSAVRDWHGRYSRIPGYTSTFHLRANNQIELDWDREGERLTLTATGDDELLELAEAVAKGKRFLGGGSGLGQFVINEFGQVLVPSSQGKGRRVIVGRIEGPIEFELPDGSIIDPGDPLDLDAGDAWPYPYVGVVYNLHASSDVYYWNASVERCDARENPPVQDESLIEALRKVRTFGAARFIVNPWGLVATKRSPTGPWSRDEQSWEPVYVGQIDYEQWFEMENA